MVNCWVPIVIVPVRGMPVMFASKLNCTVPLPVPLAPAVTAIQEAPLTAVHAHPAPAVTATEPDPLPTGATCDGGLSEI